MYLSAEDIARLEPTRKVHFLHPDAIRMEKSLGDATGLTRIGVHIITVAPGDASTEFHAHRQEEECVYVLSGFGSATIGERTVRIGPGDFIGCPANGVAHELLNTGDVPLVCLVIGQRLPVDIVDYPRRGLRLYRHDGAWDLAEVATLEHPERSNHSGHPGNAVMRPRPELIHIGQDGTPEAYAQTLSDAARGACLASAALYRTAGFVRPWICYLCLIDGQCVGTCAFKAAPRDQQVEIAYFTFPEFEGRGYATAMAQTLVDMARTEVPGIVVVALTLPEENASTKVLRKLGFRLVGRVRHPEDGEVWEWELPPPV